MRSADSFVPTSPAASTDEVGRTMLTNRATFTEIPGAAPDIMRDYDLAVLGYQETEFSIQGIAASYMLNGERGADGRWDVTTGPEATFRTRFVVRRPVDPDRFSGTAVVLSLIHI